MINRSKQGLIGIELMVEAQEWSIDEGLSDLVLGSTCHKITTKSSNINEVHGVRVTTETLEEELHPGSIYRR